MNFIVFGGAGDMGSRAVEDLVADPDIKQVTIADVDFDKAQQLASRLQQKTQTKITVKKVDANNFLELVAAMKGNDAAVSALGPFYLFEEKLIKAAIAAKVNYASINDEWQPAENVIQNLQREAQQAGIIAISGFGVSPGVSSIAVNHIRRELEQIDKVEIYVYQPIDGGGGRAVIQHMFHVISHTVACWEQGKRVEAKPLQRSLEVDMPDGQRIKVWQMGHSEPVTLPREFTDIQDCRFYMGFGAMSPAFIWPAKLGLFRSQFVKSVLSSAIIKLEQWMGVSPLAQGCLRVDIWGKQDGQLCKRSLFCGGSMRESTGSSLAVGGIMMAKGQLLHRRPGVYAPESIVDPNVFIKAMSDKKFYAYHDVLCQDPLVPHQDTTKTMA